MKYLAKVSGYKALFKTKVLYFFFKSYTELWFSFGAFPSPHNSVVFIIKQADGLVSEHML